MENNKISRKDFLKKGGLLALVTAVSASKLGNLGEAQAAVLDNTKAKDVSDDTIFITNSSIDPEVEPFRSGKSVSNLAAVVNSLNAKFLQVFESLKGSAIVKAAFKANTKEINDATRYADIVDALVTIEDKDVTTFTQSSVESQNIPAGYYAEGSKIEVDRASLLSDSNLRNGGTKTIISNGEYSTLKDGDPARAYGKFKVNISKDAGTGATLYNEGYDNGVAATKKGNASPADVRKGKTFTNTSKVEEVGTMAEIAAKTYTPTTKDQTIAASQYLVGAQTIKGDANLVAGNIAKGKSIFGVAGSFTSDANAVAGDLKKGQTAYVNGVKVTGTFEAQEKSVTAGTSATSVSADSGKYITNVTVNPTPSEAKTETAGTSAKTVTPADGKLLSQVIVNPTPSQEKTVTCGNAAQTVTPDSGKLLSKVIVNPLPSETKTETAGTSNKTVTPTDGKLLSKVIIKPTPSEAKTETAGIEAKTVTPADGKLLSRVVVNPTPSEEKTETAGTTNKTVTPATGKLLSKVIIKPTPSETKTETAGTADKTVTPTSGKLLSQVTIKPTPSQEKTVTCGNTVQTVTPDSGKLLSKVIVNPEYTFRVEGTTLYIETN